jgi:anaerobic ribonucleoside-triphosphate reductase activating protein
MSTDVLYYAGSAFPVRGLGPGKRAVLWVSGCKRACPGCMSPELWEKSHPVPVVDVAREVLPLLEQADGLTISGGEPFYQAKALLNLVRRLRAALPELEVLLFTGYVIEEVNIPGSAAAALIGELDMLVDGPYRQDLPDTLIWRGSDNQRLHLLSARAQRHAWAVAGQWEGERTLALRMLDSARCLLVGIPRRGGLEALRETLRARGFGVIPKATELDG